MRKGKSRTRNARVNLVRCNAKNATRKARDRQQRRATETVHYDQHQYDGADPDNLGAEPA